MIKTMSSFYLQNYTKRGHSYYRKPDGEDIRNDLRFMIDFFAKTNLFLRNKLFLFKLLIHFVFLMFAVQVAITSKRIVRNFSGKMETSTKSLCNFLIVYNSGNISLNFGSNLEKCESGFSGKSRHNFEKKSF